MNKDELCGRTKRFALDMIILIDELPKTLSGRAVGGQLVRSATSVAANYRAACRSRSRNEFIAKIGVVEEEADESSFWLEIIIEGNFLPKQRVQPHLNEAVELTKIMASSRKTAKEAA